MRNPVCNISLMVGLTDIIDWCYVEVRPGATLPCVQYFELNLRSSAIGRHHRHINLPQQFGHPQLVHLGNVAGCLLMLAELG